MTDKKSEVLADPENNFAISLEKLTLKKSVNNEAFEHNAGQVKGNATELDTSIHKLRQKYK